MHDDPGAHHQVLTKHRRKWCCLLSMKILSRWLVLILINLPVTENELLHKWTLFPSDFNCHWKLKTVLLSLFLLSSFPRSFTHLSSVTTAHLHIELTILTWPLPTSQPSLLTDAHVAWSVFMSPRTLREIAAQGRGRFTANSRSKSCISEQVQMQ